VATSLISSPRK